MLRQFLDEISKIDKNSLDTFASNKIKIIFLKCQIELQVY